ncbi:hypothetical protein [Streptomyces sp. Tu 3180]|uniref:hypothetical protein n=1 Tax=Streptomyces sp. Tu 3180 TaxID=2682611 RepID=UPI0013577187|nr:hypothetical protein [Streptomyces sp. Tu 3180]KAF3467043.1 hypothetical protein GL259_23875 [Streptomyces sp. Tu 3180]
MLSEAMVALAAAGGTAVVQAAGTDVWEELRARVARLLGRGAAQGESDALDRLDRTRTALESGGQDDVPEVRTRQQAAWQTRFEDLLEGLQEAEREDAANELRTLVDQVDGARPGVSAGDGGTAAGRDVNVRADGGVAGGVNNFNKEVTFGVNPPMPERERP